MWAGCDPFRAGALFFQFPRVAPAIAGATRGSEKEIAIPTNGCVVTVKENERPAAAVKAILESFVERKGRSPKFAWRDVTERFV
jgi:hypothetical protein